MNTEFEAQRAALMAELTQIALAGGDTGRTREKLAKLNDREQSARADVSKRCEAERSLRLLAAAEQGTKIGTEAAARLAIAGHEINETDTKQFEHLGRVVANVDAELSLASDAHVAAQDRVRQVEARIAAMDERSRALSALRVTGQAAERDQNEAVMIEKDLQTLRDLLASATSSAVAACVPAELQNRRQTALDAIAAHERTIILRSLREKVARTEVELLAGIRELIAVSGARHPGEVYQRNPQLDRFFRLSVL